MEGTEICTGQRFRHAICFLGGGLGEQNVFVNDITDDIVVESGEICSRYCFSNDVNFLQTRLGVD